MTIPAGIKIKPGQYARFDIFGRFLRVEDYLTNGLGLIYQKQNDGTYKRIFF